MADSPPGVDTWKEQTSAFDRVQSVATTLDQPATAGAIAEKAHVAENTARAHLDRLVEMNVLLKHEREDPVIYEPDPLHTRMQTMRDLLDDHDHDSLLELKADLQDRVTDIRDEYDADVPETLREQASDATNPTETRVIRQAANDWELLRYRLTLVEDAIENYNTYTCDRASA